ncbi:hypothetical protein LIER_41227 [Lithospermum erythrorhizon]|uniref:Uncharacterized protein n=1 Tax=Lithospermum erythrorhizon TaxID=34254 RepID=A0AAV3R825_LITER
MVNHPLTVVAVDVYFHASGQENATCLGPNGQRITACMNNRSFEPSTKLSILEALYYNVSVIYTTDFPDEPPVKFDYSNEANTFSFALLPTVRSHSVRQLKYNSTVEIIFQNTAFG